MAARALLPETVEENLRITSKQARERARKLTRLQRGISNETMLTFVDIHLIIKAQRRA